MSPLPPQKIKQLTREERHLRRQKRRQRLRRRSRRAYIRSVHLLPSMATLGNVICGFAAIYVTALSAAEAGSDPVAVYFADHRFSAAAYLIFAAMIFDALDGRLARLTRHTTDFGGQLDSMADVLSFGAAPAFLAIQLFKHSGPAVPLEVSRLIWATGALYVSCAAIRLARFNVSNEHGEQHHFSFLGLPSPGAGALIAAFVLAHQTLSHTLPALPFAPSQAAEGFQESLARILILLLPFIVASAGLLMVSTIRYPHLVNRYLRGSRSLARLIGVLAVVLLMVTHHQFTLAIGTGLFVASGPISALRARVLRTPKST